MQLIGFSGGVNANAYLDNIQVTRIADSKEVLLDINLRALAEHKEDFLLQNGDSISIREVPKIVENFVKIAGAVEMPFFQ